MIAKVDNRIALKGYFEGIEDYNESFKKVKIKVHALGKNKNYSNILPSAFEKAKESIYNIPIVAKYNSGKDKYGLNGDLESHNTILEADRNGNLIIKQDTYPIGVVSSNANITFEDINEGSEENPDIKRYIVVDNVFLWKRYDATQKIEEWLENGIVPHVSMEIGSIVGDMDSDGYFTIIDYKYEAICALGSEIEPCFPMAQIENYNKQSFSEQFYEMINELKKSVNINGRGEINLTFENEEKKKYEIDNSKESAVSGKWSDVDLSDEKEKVQNASNAESLAKEFCLILEDGWETNKSKMKYPHHVIKGDKLVLHEEGVKAAYARLMQQDPNNEDAKKHIERHRKTLGFDDENDKENNYEANNKLDKDKNNNKENDDKNFSLTSQQLAEEIRNELEEVTFLDEDWWGDPVVNQRYYYIDHDDQFVYVYDDAEDAYFKIPYSLNGDEVEIDYEKASRIKWSPVDWEGQDDEQSNFVKNYKKCFMNKFEKMHKQELDKSNEEHQKMMDKMEEMMKEMKGQMADLMQFKENKLKAEKETEINKVFEQFSKQLTAEEIAPLREKAMEMDIEVLRKELFAMVGMKLASFNANEKPKFNVMGINLKPSNQSGETVWDKYKSNI